MATMQVIDYRLEQLDDLSNRIASADIANGSEFSEVLGLAMRVLELSQDDVAESLLVSRPSVNRWLKGTNLPARALRSAILRWIDQQTEKRMRVVSRNRSLAG